MKWQWAIVALVLLFPAKGRQAVLAAAPPDAAADSLAELKQQARRQMDKAYGPLPLAGKLDIHDIVSLRDEQGVLVASTAMPLSRNRTHVQPGDVNGEGMITVMPLGRSKSLPFIVFDYTDLTPAEVIQTHIQILSQPTQLQLVRDIEAADKTITMTLMQTVNPLHVTLRIQDVPETDAGQPATRPATKLLFEADSFAALRRGHPVEVNQYVRPLFRDLHQDAGVFAVDRHIAWQVLYDGWQAPPNIAGRVRPLLEQLNEDTYARRADADRQLRELGEDAALYLLSADGAAWSAEQKARVNAITAPYRQLTAEQARAMGNDADFLLDCLDTADAALKQAALARLQKLVGRKVEFDATADGDARSHAVDQLRQQIGAAAQH